MTRLLLEATIAKHEANGLLELWNAHQAGHISDTEINATIQNHLESIRERLDNAIIATTDA